MYDAPVVCYNEDRQDGRLDSVCKHFTYTIMMYNNNNQKSNICQNCPVGRQQELHACAMHYTDCVAGEK